MESSHQTELKQEPHEKLVGVKGWLSLFVVSLGLGTILHAAQLILYVVSAIYILSNVVVVGGSDGNIFTAITSMSLAMWLQIITKIIAIGLAICVLVLIKKHKSLAIKLAIIFLIFNAIALTIDYNWVWLIFVKFNFVKILFYDPMHTALSVGLGIIPAIIWIPYLLKSQRVKATLK